jgi:hypothetical protein
MALGRLFCWFPRCSLLRALCTICSLNGDYPLRTRFLDGLLSVRYLPSCCLQPCIPFTYHLSTWLRAVSASLFPFLYRVKHQDPYSKILSYFLAFSACFVILSISVEGLFFLSYSALLVVWVEVEAAIRSPLPRFDTTKGIAGGKNEGVNAVVVGYHPRADDLRIALFFLFFVQIAFFGTGNVASISCAHPFGPPAVVFWLSFSGLLPQIVLLGSSLPADSHFQSVLHGCVVGKICSNPLSCHTGAKGQTFCRCSKSSRRLLFLPQCLRH